MRISAQFLRFCVVGGIGFLTDALLLELGVEAGLAPAVARMFSVLVALQVTYALHRSFTFRAGHGRGVKRWMRFLGVNLIGCAVNYAVFILALYELPFEDGRVERLLALVISTGVSLMVNYTMNRLFVFPKTAL